MPQWTSIAQPFFPSFRLASTSLAYSSFHIFPNALDTAAPLQAQQELHPEGRGHIREVFLL